jgi:hypothetical protein
MSTARIQLQRLGTPLAFDWRLRAARRSLRLAVAPALHAVAVAGGVAGLLAVAALPFAATVVLG